MGLARRIPRFCPFNLEEALRKRKHRIHPSRDQKHHEEDTEDELQEDRPHHNECEFTQEPHSPITVLTYASPTDNGGQNHLERR